MRKSPDSNPGNNKISSPKKSGPRKKTTVADVIKGAIAKREACLAPGLIDEENERMAGSYFFGFHVHGSPVCENLVGFSKKNSALVPRATWTDDSKLHVTLKFVGKECPESESLLKLCLKTPAFKMPIKGLGIFANRSGPRVLFAQLGQEETLKKLHGQLGGRPDTFTPHLTLAKLEDIGDAEPEFSNIVQQNHAVDFGTAFVDELRLYQTQGDGKPYRIVAWHRLIG